MILVKRTLMIEEAALEAGIAMHRIQEWIEHEWIQPEDRNTSTLDQEDIARARLIQNLIDDFGVNDESMLIILHLLDQLHNLHYQLRRGGVVEE